VAGLELDQLFIRAPDCLH